MAAQTREDQQEAADGSEFVPQGEASLEAFRDSLELYRRLSSDCGIAAPEDGFACRLRKSLELLVQAIRLYGPCGVIGSFNGGKDAVVVMHLLRAALAHWCVDHQELSCFSGAGGDCISGVNIGKVRIWQPNFVFFRSKDEFPEVETFVMETVRRLALRVDIHDCGWLEGLNATMRLPNEKGSNPSFGITASVAFVLGTRQGDPNCGDQQRFAPSSLGLRGIRPFMRINPLLDWTYGDVWFFLRHYGLSYCVLYDQGYTSLGNRATTQQNPALLRSDGTYDPAYKLVDGSLERAGRIDKTAPIASSSASKSLSPSHDVLLGPSGGTAGLIIIGDEVLKGQIVDTNTPFAARQLRACGIALRRVAVVSDTREDIIQELRVQSASYDVVFTSGGLGPTHDDVTIVAVGAAFDMPLVENDAMLQILRRRSSSRCDGDNTTVSSQDQSMRADRKMALLPEGSVLRRPPHDGSEDECWPVLQCRNVFVLPGVPVIFHEKLTVVCDHFLSGAPGRPHTKRVLLTASENEVTEIITAVAEAHRPVVTVGSYPVTEVEKPGVETVVTFESRHCGTLDKAVKEFTGRLEQGVLVSMDADDAVSPAGSPSQTPSLAPQSVLVERIKI
eukprot:TRINITY_DN43284_c0_g1_i1.p1 TRINITY_DN43284_c0_g1~~TRINITY_DN43284_c0_g1_i1.p1  ORF type:complete len:627 (+),score=95.90 TRINITY_DN43284_c0_g1_i1:31-1881(+)